MSRSPTTNEIDPARALEWTLHTLRQTEAALARLCEELLKERRRSAQALRCASGYRGLYHQARAQLAVRKAGGRAGVPPSKLIVAKTGAVRVDQRAKVTLLPTRQ